MITKLITMMIMVVVLSSCAHQALQQTPQFIPTGLDKPVPIRNQSVSLDTPTHSGKNIWQRIRKKLAFKNIDHPRIHEQLRLVKNNQKLNAMIEQGQPLLYYLVQLAERRKLPLELVLLPMIESGFHPRATSPGNAAGLWQFRPATARNFGLVIDEYYDARYDIHASTEAALDYLEYLYEFFDNDWLLAIAAYNCGEGTVQKAILRNKNLEKNIDFWALDNLPLITRDYVPKLLAVSKIIMNPKAYGVRLQPIPDSAYLEAVEIAQAVNPLKLIASSSIKQEIALKFNPAFINGLNVVPHSPYRLLLPLNEALLLNLKLAEQSAMHLAGWTKEKPVDHHESRSSLQPSDSYSHMFHGSNYLKDKSNNNHWIDYIANKGDTLELLAHRYGLPVKLLARLNNINSGRNLKKGQKLIIPTLEKSERI